MRRVVSVLLVLVLACFVSASVASAKGKGKGKKNSPAKVFAKMDTNNDQKVTKEEFVAYQKDHHKKNAKKQWTPEKAEKQFSKIASGKDSFTLDDYNAFIKQQKEKKANKKKS